MVAIIGLSLVVFANMPIRIPFRPRVLSAAFGGFILLTGLLIPSSI